MTIDTQSECKETMQIIIKQNIDLFPEKDTGLGSTRTIKMSIDFGSYPQNVETIAYTIF